MDETWIYHRNPQTKRLIIEYCESGSSAGCFQILKSHSRTEGGIFGSMIKL